MGTTAIAGGFTVGSTGGGPGRPNTYNGSIMQMNDDVSLVRGAHQISLGVNGLLQRYYQTNGFVDTGTWTFASTVTGIGMGDFMLGKLTTLATGAKGYYAIRQYSVALYATDSWKVSQRLSVNYGVRWEPYIPQDIPNNYVYSFDTNRFAQGIKSSVYLNSPSGLYYPGDPGFPGDKGIYDKWAHFAPRVGVAWDPFGDGKPSIRGSYGFSYNFVSAQWRLDSAGSAPFQNRNTQSSPVGGFDDPWQGFSGGNPFPYVLDKNVRFTPYSNITSLSYGIKTPATSAWNLSVQHQFGADWLASATYIGTETEHMWTFQAINPAQFLGPQRRARSAPSPSTTATRLPARISGEFSVCSVHRTGNSWVP